jgi:hypothetical protein
MVFVRLRCVVLRRPVVYRLFVLGGIALVGWLLGCAGQAHAETGPASGAGLTRTVVSTTLPAGTAAAQPVGRAVHRVTPAEFVRGVTIPVQEPEIRGLPGENEQVRARIIPARGGAGADAPRSSRHHGDDARAMAPPAVIPGNVSQVTAEFRDGPVQFRPGPVNPASQPGFPDRTACAAGSVQIGGTVGNLPRVEAARQPAIVSAFAVNAVPPAVHTATDEPALSPD